MPPSDEPECWEHLIVVLPADAERFADELERRWPGQRFARYSPASLVPQLDIYGEQGWRLVSILPVILGDNADVAMAGQYERWARDYLCAFIRPKP